MSKKLFLGILLIMIVVMSFGCIAKDDPALPANKGDVIALTAKLQVLQNTVTMMESRFNATQDRLSEIQNQQRNLMDLVQSLKADMKNPSSNSLLIDIQISTDGGRSGPAGSFSNVDEAMIFLNKYR